MRKPCPKCKKQLLESSGNIASKVLIVGEYPGFEEIRIGRPFVGRTGEVLQSELMRVGIQMSSCHLTNLWAHAKDEKGCDVKWHTDRMVKEFKGKTHVLLMGSDVSRALIGDGIAAHSGLQIRMPEFKGTKFWVSPNPAAVFRSPIGELRMAIERFALDLTGK